MFASCHNRASPVYTAIDDARCAVMLRLVTWIGSDEASSAPSGCAFRSLYVLLTFPSAAASPVARFIRTVFAVVIIPPSTTRGDPVSTTISSTVVYSPRCAQAFCVPST